MRRSRRAAGLPIAFMVTIAITFGGMSPPAIAVDSPANKLTEAQNNLVSLETKAEQAQHRYAAALTQEHAAEQAATASERQSKAATMAADHARTQLGLLVAAAYRAGPGASLSSLTVVLDAHDADDYLHGIQQTQRVVVNGDEVLAHASAATAQANAAQQRADANLAALSAAKTLIAQSTAEATEAVATASRDLDTLGLQFDTLLQRRHIATETPGAPHQDPNTQPITPPRPDVPNAASRALNFALAQIGKPYLWGATGPDSFDCSGLTMRAYEAAGVHLPHFAAFQYAASHPLAVNDLQPGDLLFWATNPRKPATIYHEALYLGGGLMVQAPKSHWRISVASMWIWGPIQFYARPY